MTKISKYIILIALFLSHLSPLHASIGMKELGDSLTVWAGFSSAWSASVKVTNLRVNGNKVTVQTNKALKDVRWTPENLNELKHKISVWVLGHENGKITLQSVKTPVESFLTNCAKGISAIGTAPDLTDRNIVVYPSHGLYYNRDRDEWIWQRATLWTTVEDLYSYEYVRLIQRMLENAGANVIMPRASLNRTEPGVSGLPQWTEGARYWLINQGVDSTLWNIFEGDEYKDDMKCRALWINSLKTPIDLCLALHTDGIDSGNDSTIIGTLAIYTSKDDNSSTRLRDGRDRETVNRNLADWIQTQVTNDLRTIAPEWTRRQLKEANYCESRVPEVPAIILELLSHKNMADMKYGLDPTFRFAASRAVYKGILRYLNGTNAVVQPLPVKELGIHEDGTLQWIPTIDSLEPSATPTYYMVYTQANEGEWNVQQVEGDTHVSVELTPGVRYNYYVVAGNEGGLSMPSPVISAYLNATKDQMVLVVDGFNDVYGPEWFADSTYAGIVPGSYACEDYFSCAYIGQQWNYTRTSTWKDDDNCGWGACYRDHAGELTVGNTHDYAVQHGRVLRRMNISYVSCTSGVLPSYTLHPTPYTMVDFICGRNRVPLTADQQQQIAGYIAAGGRVLLSTDHFSALPADWTNTYLHARYHASQATRSGRITTPRHRLYNLWLEPNAQQLFTCHPEGLKPLSDQAVRMASYEDMRCAAGVGFEHQTLVYAFPLEAIMDFEKLYKHSIEWLLENEKEKLTDF